MLRTPRNDDYNSINLLSTRPRSIAQIVDDLAQAFKAPRERIETDVMTLIGGLAEKKLLELA